MKKFLQITACSAAVLTASMTSSANTVMLKYKTQSGQEITIKSSQLEEMYKKLPPEMVSKLPKDKVMSALRDQELAGLLLKDAAAAAGLANDPKVKEMAQKLLESSMVTIYVEQKIAERITPQAREAIYKEVTEAMKNQKLYDISIIQVRDNDHGMKVVQLLDANQDFGSVAQKNSINKETAAQGGKVGSLPEALLTRAFGPDLMKAISILKDGKHSKQVIKNPEGKFFELKLNGSRMAPIPTMKAAEKELNEILAKKALMDIIVDLKTKAEKANKFSSFDSSGKPQAPVTLDIPTA